MFRARFYFNIVAFVFASVLGCSPSIQYNLLTFDETHWKTTTDDRTKMVEDLYKNHLRKGMSKVSIKKMLGTPERILLPSEFSDPSLFKGMSECWSYELPLDSCFDTHTFNIHLDASGNYMGYHIFCN